MFTQSKRNSLPAPLPAPDPTPGSRSARAAIRREQVLSAALALFCEHGYAGTSTRRIAEAAGITEGLVFHYFPTKDALLMSLAARRNTFAGQVLTQIERREAGTAKELFSGIAAAFAEVSAEEGAFIGFLLAEAQVNPDLRALITGANAVVMGRLLHVLEQHVRTGELRKGASLRAATYGFFGGFLFFFTEHRHLGPAAWRREAGVFARALSEQCWRGLATEGVLSAHSTIERKRVKR